MSGAHRVRCVVAGIVAGVAGGLFGVGGGIVLVPLLHGWLGATQHQAHGTSLAVIGVTALASIPVYAFHGNVAWLTALGIAITSVLFAGVGARLAARMSPGQLKLAFAAFMVVVAIRLLWHPPSGVSAGGWHHGVTGVAFDLALGTAIGTMSGLLGVGGGILIVPALTLLVGVHQQMAQGTSLAVILASAPAGAAEHTRHRNVLWGVVPWLAVGAATGGIAASSLAQAMPRTALTRAFALFLLVNAGATGWLTWRARRKPQPAASAQGS